MDKKQEKEQLQKDLEQKKINNKEYWIIKSRFLSGGLRYLTGQKPYIFDNHGLDAEKFPHLYVYRNTDSFKRALSLLNANKSELRAEEIERQKLDKKN